MLVKINKGRPFQNPSITGWNSRHHHTLIRSTGRYRPRAMPMLKRPVSLILYNSPKDCLSSYAQIWIIIHHCHKQKLEEMRKITRLTLNISKWQTRSGLSAKLSPETTRFLQGLLLTSHRPLFPRLATLGPLRMSTEQSDPTQPSAQRQTPEQIH